MRYGLLIFLVFNVLISFGQNATDVIPIITAAKIKPIPSQTDLGEMLNSLFHIKKRHIPLIKGKEVYFNFLPLALNPPGGSNALITSTSAGFYLGSKDSTYLSTASFAPYWNFGTQFGLPLRGNLWLNKNQGLLEGDVRFLFYPQYTWGLGNGVPENQKILVNYKYFRTYLTGYKRVLPYLYLGLGFNMDYHLDITTPDSSLQVFTGYPFGTREGSNSISISPTLNALYDHRYKLTQLLPFSYFHLIYRQNLIKNIGKSANWTSLFIDIRRYIPFGANPLRQNILAFRTFFWDALGGSTPYLDLPSIGWDPYERSGRGIEQNRYRGKALIYFELEYRKDLTQNGLLGFVVFSNLNSALVPESGKFETFHPAFGAGIRVKVSKESKTNLAVDYAFSRSYSGLWLSLGEAF
jgi:hypothetical protein